MDNTTSTPSGGFSSADLAALLAWRMLGSLGPRMVVVDQGWKPALFARFKPEGGGAI